MTVAGRILAAVLAGVVVGSFLGCGRDQPSAPTHSVAAYLVPWDERSQVLAGDGVLTEVSPVWFQPTETGEVVFASEEARRSAASVDAGGVSLTPSISNFRNGHWDGELIGHIVGDPTRRAAHVQAIVELVRSGDWSGIDIDYESMPTSSRDAYSSFVADLAAALDGVPARLSVTVHAKTAEPGTWSGARAQDWRAIGAAADEVRVLAYDYASAESPPGPIAPAAWVDQVLRLATSLVPPDRIVLGLPTYGYDWTAGAAGTALQWADVRATADARNAPTQWDSDHSAPWLKYTDEQGRNHTVWYENAHSIAAKLDVARRHRVDRVVLWRLGGEDPDIWSTLRSAW
jgi:spore germination protein YaaH